MRIIPRAFPFLLCAVATAFVAGCSADKVQKNQDSMTNSYENYQEKRQIRAEARQDRSDAWFNRIMGEPVKSSDTGLKLP